VLEQLKRLDIVGKRFSSFVEVARFIKEVPLEGCGKCAVELALLDAAGKCFKKPVSEAFGKVVKNELVYSGIIATDSLLKTRMACYQMKLYGFRQAKIKVGFENDVQRLGIARKILGAGTDIRVDANCAWKPEEAIERINELKQFNISAVEQPVVADDINGMRKVRLETSIPIIADESLCTIDDAKRLAKARACDIFNIRLSKCGGILNSYGIYGLAKAKKIGYMLGCMVGETGILSAAGRHFAQCIPGLKWLEGSYDRFVLKKRYVNPDMTFGKGGVAKAIDGYGLGVELNEKSLRQK
jgi:L-alanine-DL-glutamate epimerase-like enolase superfamily enzyme